MNDTVLSLYHRLPSPLRSMAASLRGFSLRRLRYGPESERLMQEALARERWDAGAWEVWRQERLAHVLHRAATRVPYYRAQWEARRRRGDAASWERLENWPILDKKPLQENARAFIADDRDARRMAYDHTSGTSGTPLDLWISRRAIREWFAMWEIRGRLWNGVSRNDVWSTMGGQLIVPPQSDRPPFWVWNPPLNQLYLSANHVSPRNAKAYIEALNRYRVTHIVGYSFAVAALAREAHEQRLTTPDLRLVLTIAEPLTPWQRETIRAGFGCEVRETYGMSEQVASATECPAGTLHLWPEVGHIEVLDDREDAPAPAGSIGRFIATGLLNDDMPLVRYRLGDRGVLAPLGSACRCGRLLPSIAAVEGRVDDVLYAKDGRMLGRLDPVFKAHLPIREAQIIQESLDRVRIRYVPMPGYTEDSSRAIIERLQARMGPVEVVMEAVDKVPRGANGKFRAVISMLNTPGPK